jgi:Zn-dependent membrane protease YugP
MIGLFDSLYIGLTAIAQSEGAHAGLFDPLYIALIAPTFILSLYASWKVKHSFNKFSKKPTVGGKTGAQIAREILDRNGLSNVSVEITHGMLSDHYDPGKKSVRLSEEVYNGQNIAAIGVAAHETGHAIQHKLAYRPLVLRNMMVPIASIGSNFSWIIIMAGFVLGHSDLILIGIILFTTIVVFQLITLPVEFDASNRAKQILYSQGLVNSNELAGVNKVLGAAAMTYVAAAASAIMTLLYFLIRSGLLGGNNRD